LAQVAEFISRNKELLDKAAVGEYFGHHEDFQVRVMHAYIDLQRYQGTTIDVALRALMDEFRCGAGRRRAGRRRAGRRRHV
jgi:Sec7-like guanine-nucleotide exchange factor